MYYAGFFITILFWHGHQHTGQLHLGLGCLLLIGGEPGRRSCLIWIAELQLTRQCVLDVAKLESVRATLLFVLALSRTVFE